MVWPARRTDRDHVVAVVFDAEALCFGSLEPLVLLAEMV